MSLKSCRNCRGVNRCLFGLPLALMLLASCVPPVPTSRVILSGSSTLAPVASRAADRWKQTHPKVEVRVEGIGSDAGLERLIQYDEADLALVSRPLTEADLATAEKAGKTLTAWPLAWDAVCIVVAQTNTWARSLTSDQAVKAFTVASQWNDLDPTWPTVPIHRFVLGVQSGTTEVLAARWLGGDETLLLSAPGVQASEDDQIVARGVASVEGAIGFLGWTTVKALDLPLRTLAIDGIEPNEASIREGTYGLRRQLWVVGDRSLWKTRPEVRAFLQSLFDRYPEVLEGTSLVPLTSDEQRAVQATLVEE